MREVQLSEAELQLPRLLDAVEQGETIVITRQGRPIARLVPEKDIRRAQVRQAMERVDAFRRTMPRLCVEDILAARREGHKD